MPVSVNESGIPSEDTVTITVNGKQIAAAKGEMIISATDRAGVNVPRFCYHPRMKPVGMCRMCLVEVSGPRGMSLQPACYLPVADGMEVVTDSEKVRKAQDGVLEFLLVNHPLDCPVCDKGGECPLQDQTLAYGPGESRFVEEKRHWAKPIELSDLVLLDRERCIQCARCTRFASEIAGDPLIDFFSRGDSTEVAIAPGEKFTSYFSGNTVQICPVGALTATPYRFAARPWDLEQVESTCTSCATGCRVVVQSSSNQVIRYLGVDSDPVNQSWLCDKGRFDFEAHRAGSRVTVPMVREGGELVECTWAEALRKAAEGIGRAMEVASDPSSAVGVIGGARLANEDAYAWAKLVKSVIGTDSVDADLGDGLPADAVLGLPKATIDEVCSAPLVLVMTPDLRELAPILFLRLKAAAQSGRTKVIELTSVGTALGRYATETLVYRPGEAASLVAALFADSDPKPLAAGMEIPPIAGVAASDVARTRALLAGFSSAVAVVGRPSLAESTEATVAAVAALSAARPETRYLTVHRRGNLHGALDAGLAPGILPGRVTLEGGRSTFAAESGWGRVPASTGMSTHEILRSAAQGSLGALILLGADPVVDFPDHESEKALSGGAFVVAVTAHLCESARRADVVLPAAMYAERGGTTTNFEGRVTTLGKKVTPPGQAWEDWAIAAELATALGSDLGFTSFDDIAAERTRLVPLFRHFTPHIWNAPSTRDGVLLPLATAPVGLTGAPRALDPVATPGIGSLPHHAVRPPSPSPLFTGTGTTGPSGAVASPGAVRFSRPASPPDLPAPDAYSLRLVAPYRLYDCGTHVVGSAHLAALAPVGTVRVNHYDLDRLGASTGDTLRAVSPGGSHQVVVEVDDEVQRGTAVMGFNLAVAEGSVSARSLIDLSAPVTDIRLEAHR